MSRLHTARSARRVPVAAAIAVFLVRAGLPPVIRWAFIFLFAAGVIAYFPFRTIP